DEPSNFSVFMELLQSRSIAERLSKDPRIVQTLFPSYWDEESNDVSPRSFVVRQLQFIGSKLINRPYISVPLSDLIYDYLQEHVTIAPHGSTRMQVIQYRYPNDE